MTNLIKRMVKRLVRPRGLSTRLRKAAEAADSVFIYIEQNQSSKFVGCTGARELAAIYYRVKDRQARLA